MPDLKEERWDEFFAQRAERRNGSPDVETAQFAMNHPFEVFIGTERKTFRDREPAFKALEHACRWARGRSDGRPWMVRSSATGVLVCDSESKSKSESDRSPPQTIDNSSTSES